MCDRWVGVVSVILQLKAVRRQKFLSSYGLVWKNFISSLLQLRISSECPKTASCWDNCSTFKLLSKPTQLSGRLIYVHYIHLLIISTSLSHPVIKRNLHEPNSEYIRNTDPLWQTLMTHRQCKQDALSQTGQYWPTRQTLLL